MSSLLGTLFSYLLVRTRCMYITVRVNMGGKNKENRGIEMYGVFPFVTKYTKMYKICEVAGFSI